ncbi:YdbH domain-containing protein [Minwuia sp. IMCC3009]|uniref:intermembrane phospholipid transport protein YdbH family protein n=1 Tax=Minwuia sp. IMCC3009 TaxID=3040674 RepID=UPI00247AD7D5|nr:YdbH domain-containing protein [Minwuia sp. IMCC3009]
MPQDGARPATVAWPLRILGILAVVLLVMLGGLVLFRHFVVESLAVAYLEGKGVAPVELTVSALGPDGIELRAVAIGDLKAPHVSARRIIVGFDGMSIGSVDVHGLGVRVAHGPDGLDAGPVMRLAESAEGSPADASVPLALPADLPTLGLHGVQVLITKENALHGLTLGGDYRLHEGQLDGSGPIRVSGALGLVEGELRVDLASDLTGGVILSARDVSLNVPGLRTSLAVASLDLTLGRQPDLISADLTAALPGGDLTGSLLLAAPFDQPTIDLGVQASLGDLAQTLPLISDVAGDLPVSGGSADLSFALVATADADVTIPDIAGLIRTSVGEVRLEGDLRLPASAHSAGADFGDIALDLAADGKLGAGEITLDFNRLSLTSEAVPKVAQARDLALRYGPGASFAVRPGMTATLALAEPGAISFRGGLDTRSGPLRLAAELENARLSGTGLDVTGATLTVTGLSVMQQDIDRLHYDGKLLLGAQSELHGRLQGSSSALSVGDADAETVSAALALDLTVESAERLRVRLNGPVRAGRLALAEPAVSIDAPEIALEEVQFALVPGKGMVTRGAFVASSGPVTAPEIAESQFTLEPMRFGFDLDGYGFGTMYGSVTLDSDGLSAPGLARSGPLRIRGKVRPSPQSVKAEISVADMNLDGLSGLSLPPMSFDGTLDVLEARAALAGRLSSGAIGIDVSADADPATGAAQARMVLPETALPLLAEVLRDVVLPAGTALPEGSVSAEVTLRQAEALSADLDLNVTNGSVAVTEFALSGINGTLHLEELLPPRTDAPQEVRIALLSGPADIRDMLLRFELAQDGDETIARILDLHGDVLGGRMAMRPFELRADETRRRIDVDLQRIDMATIVDLAGLEDFILTGSLSGTLPVEIVGENGVVVRQGKLVADGPGTLQLDGNVLRGILGQQGGDELDLMIRTLEDFRYDVLEVSLDKPLEGETTMLITLGGLNPAVLDGHPFRFNISVSGDADRLLATILTVYRASSGMIEQGIKSLQ